MTGDTCSGTPGGFALESREQASRTVARHLRGLASTHAEATEDDRAFRTVPVPSATCSGWAAEAPPSPNVLLVGADGDDEQRLSELLSAAGFADARLAFCASSHCRSRFAADADGGGAWEGACAEPGLVIEALTLDFVQRCRRVLRADPHFGFWPLLVSLNSEQLAQPDTTDGFDDFVLRPYSLQEIGARLRIAWLRRERTCSPPPLGTDGMEVDAVAREIHMAERTVRLTVREFSLFAFLRARRGISVSRRELLVRVWGHQYRGGVRTVDTHVSRLRSKFGPLLRIETVRFDGYRLLAPLPGGA